MFYFCLSTPRRIVKNVCLISAKRSRQLVIAISFTLYNLYSVNTDDQDMYTSADLIIT
jgi:hypothetical protein